MRLVMPTRIPSWRWTQEVPPYKLQEVEEDRLSSRKEEDPAVEEKEERSHAPTASLKMTITLRFARKRQRMERKVRMEAQMATSGERSTQRLDRLVNSVISQVMQRGITFWPLRTMQASQAAEEPTKAHLTIKVKGAEEEEEETEAEDLQRLLQLQPTERRPVQGELHVHTL